MHIKLTSTLPPQSELELDPLLGTIGYRVQTDLQSGDCSGGNSDGCEPYTLSARDKQGNAYCARCEYGAP